MKREYGPRILIGLVGIGLGFGAGALVNGGLPVKTATAETNSPRTIRDHAETAIERPNEHTADEETSVAVASLSPSATTPIVPTDSPSAPCPPTETELLAALDSLEMNPAVLFQMAQELRELNEEAQHAPSQLRDELIQNAHLTAEESREFDTIVDDLENEIQTRMSAWFPDGQEAPMDEEAFLGPRPFESALDEFDNQIGVLQAFRDAQTRLNELLGPERMAQLQPSRTLISYYMRDDWEPEEGPDLRGI